MATKTGVGSPEAFASSVNRWRKSRTETVDGASPFWAADVASALRKAGWTDVESYSTCVKASYEAKLGKGDRRVEITAANFLGCFVQISFR